VRHLLFLPIPWIFRWDCNGKYGTVYSVFECRDKFLFPLLAKLISLAGRNTNYTRDHQNMGNRYLEIFQGKRSDYYAAISSVSRPRSFVVYRFLLVNDTSHGSFFC
jgi:hypothetical protein